jgi:TolA-binding protein
LQRGVLYDTSIPMLRLRFGSGAILGLVLGIPAGAVIALLLLPGSSPTDQAATATALQVQELTRKLETAKDDRQRVDKQLEQFQKLAEQMTTSFNNLEQRFKALQEDQRLQEAQARRVPAPVVPAPVVPAPVAQPAVAPAAPAAAAATPVAQLPADQAPPAPAGPGQAGPAEDVEPAPEADSQ